MITATKNGIIRHFSEDQWKNMPKNKFGWVVTSDNIETSNNVNIGLIQKKMISGQVVGAERAVPEEVIIQKKAVETVKENAVPEEIKIKHKRTKQ